ncbi:predicted protein [Lichtheimia corymbifera JMRC:FSU:9682]|uniref:Uncharacterized protein n=1 Tax=Lichtheimia corymbifera JMRC:FSU:9682 TaxID=1263082 RepID=A0A068RP56_9FUNG|nr:predicted protein [Lichtheimia corymbifera JMRC:FSU:9682]
MDAIKSSGEISWNVALVTWRVIRKNDHVNTAEDDDGLDGIDEMTYILAKGALQPWMLSEYSSQINPIMNTYHGMCLIPLLCLQQDTMF